jgi:uncharacterized protein YecT (DUF1311 family)
MTRTLALLALMAGPAAAQQMSVNPQAVDACFYNAAPGEVQPACLGAAANACQALPGGQTTIGISQCIGAETATWDAHLNAEYQTRRAEFGDQTLRDMLRDAQRAWIAYRDAQCALDYQRWIDGSIRTIVAANCFLTMTAQRALELRDMGRM